MNFEKGNIGVKDGTAIHRQGLYKLPDIVQKLRDDPSWLSVKPPPKSRSPHLLLNVSIELFASSAVPPCLKMLPMSNLVLYASPSAVFNSNLAHKMNVIQNKNATKLILNQDRVNQAVMNFEKGNISVKDGTAIHRQGLYKLNDIVLGFQLNRLQNHGLPICY
jgi:hypothetical protein